MSATITQVIAAGDQLIIGNPANYFYCYAATTELTFTIETMDGERTFPLDRGTGWQAPFERVTVTNATGSAQTVTIISFNVPELPVRGYFDQRELAAQVAVDGGIVTNTAPLKDQGGSVNSIGSSLWSGFVDADTNGSILETLISPSLNTNGVYIRLAHIVSNSVPSTGVNQFIYTSPGSSNYLLICREPGVSTLRDQIYLPPGVGLYLRVSAGVVTSYAYWDYL